MMPSLEKPRILLVDDEPAVLGALRRNLSPRFEVVTACGAGEGIPVLQRSGPFSVVVSDLGMPEMDGATFLGFARQVAPETVRILLTGQPDVDGACHAVNEGEIYRFLTKPCAAGELLAAVEAAVEQHRKIVSERSVLEQTLHGSLQALMDLLALANPGAFGRAMRIKQVAREISRRIDVPRREQLGMAALLSQIGVVTLPAETAEKLYWGQELLPDEQALVDRVPLVTEQLLGNIPGLDEVREILFYQNHPYVAGEDANVESGEALPLESRILKVATHADRLETAGLSSEMVVASLRGRKGSYDPFVLRELAEYLHVRSTESHIREMGLREVSPGMIFAEDVRTISGALLIPAGHEVTETLVELIWSFSEKVAVQEPIRVMVPPLALPLAPAS